MEERSPTEKLQLISPEQIRDTPLELMRDAMLQHFEEDRHIKRLVERLDRRLDPESDEYVLAPLQPYMQAASGLGIVWKLLFAIGSAVVIWLQIKSYFIHGIIK